MQRILVFGPPGSGKSTLARRIGEANGLPVFHLDQAFWRPGWVRVPDAEFAHAVEDIVSRPAWVIDGNYTGTIESRLSRADTVVYLDVPRSLAIYRIVRRSLSQWGRVRQDAALGCVERLDWAFLRFAWNWNVTSRTKMLDRVAAFNGLQIVLRGRDARFPWQALDSLIPLRRPS
ncbi:AAA family ATPase [Methylobacterium sp. J-090]|uniref:AAA family ATPase n=1 Tax=Methylobacterium sp. J-090 TaxID=2836666 RepID=UPI001FBB9A16|nr:AAA family ATPase [Methylobacterium sp. J-090]MCJ2083664.1 hypothetical protein [Methylobacterium sp. J-090]